jgi:crotonobetainyl-CoA:carnitine CoA-transferase CaiB-like acyl-CoA transferase
MLVELEHPDAGPLPQIGLPIKLRNNPGSVRTPAPALGSATQEVLAELGYEGTALEALMRAA